MKAIVEVIWFMGIAGCLMIFIDILFEWREYRRRTKEIEKEKRIAAKMANYKHAKGE